MRERVSGYFAREVDEMGLKDILPNTKEEREEPSAKPRYLYAELLTHIGKWGNTPLQTLLELSMALEVLHMAAEAHEFAPWDSGETWKEESTLEQSNRIHLLLGDYYYANFFSFIHSKAPAILHESFQVIEKMIEGEIQHYKGRFDIHTTEGEYFKRVYKKQAVLMGFCCRVGGVLSGKSRDEVEVLSRFGDYLGMGIKIKKDCDRLYKAMENRDEWKKFSSTEGLVTLPLIHYMKGKQNGQNEFGDGKLILKMASLGPMDLKQLRDDMERKGAFRYVREKIKVFAYHARRQLDYLPNSPIAEDLKKLSKEIEGIGSKKGMLH